MAANLFRMIALENESTIPYTDNYTDNVLALDSQLRGIDFALEQLSSLSKIKAILLKNKDRKLSKASIKIGKLAVENISQSLGLQHEIGIISLEGFKEDTDTNVAIESITDTIKKIWESILKTFKNIWEKIVSFFSSNKARSNNDVSRARRTEKEFKDIQEEIKKNEVVLPQMPFIETSQFTIPLKYLNRELTDKDIFDLIEDISILGKQLKFFIDEVENTHSIIEQQIAVVSKAMDNDPVGGSTIAMLNQEQMFNGIFNFIQNLPGLDDSQTKLREHLNEAIPKDTKVDSNSVRILNKLNYGSGICFYTLINDPNPYRYNITVLQNCYEDSDTVKFKVFSPENIDLFAVKVVALTNASKELTDHTETKIRSIKTYHTKIISFLETNQKNINEVNEDVLLRNFGYIRNITTAILELAINSSKSFEAYFSTVHYFAELNEYFKKYYEEAVKKATT